MSFPIIKRAEIHNDGYCEDKLKAERRSRAVWAKALAEALKEFDYSGDFSDDELYSSVIKELLRVANEDEK
jgi:hypothetical protein